MEEMVTIKLRNSFGCSFDTFFTMLSQKTSRKNKFFDLPGFFSMTKTKKVDSNRLPKSISPSPKRLAQVIFGQEVAKFLVNKLVRVVIERIILVKEKALVPQEVKVV